MGVAGSHAQALASEFRAESESLIALAATMDEREWTADCPTEGRSVGVVVGHIAEGHQIIGGSCGPSQRAVRCRFRHDVRSSKARR
jgi:hypothetical protein